MKILVNKGEFSDLIQKEWIITNGIGGFSASTVVGANTRKYHGLLIASLMPPARRHLILSKVDESIEIKGKKYPLYTNLSKSFISEGYKNLKEFEKKYVPSFRYQIDDVKIEKTIALKHGENTVVVSYDIKNGENSAKLILAPIINFRDFHQVNKDDNFNLKEEINILHNTENIHSPDRAKVKMVIKNQENTPFYMICSEGNYIEHKNDIFKNMFYLEEEKRGFDAEDDLIIPGRYEINLQEYETKNISFVFSLKEDIENINAKDVINSEILRLKNIIDESKLIPEYFENESKEEKDSKKKQNLKTENGDLLTKEQIEDFIIATDNFVTYRPSFGLHTIIAGFPWFLDWGRDSLIAFEGLLLKTKRFQIAKEVLLTFIRDVKEGLVPNGYSEYDNKPLYNSADASLLLFENVKKYLDYTNNNILIKDRFYNKLKEIIEYYKNGTDLDENNIYMDKDYLLNTGTISTQNTWMDVKIGDFAVTPRNGKVVELNALWYNALKIMAELSLKYEKNEIAKKVSDEYEELAENVQKAFNKKFWNIRKNCLFDVVATSLKKSNDPSIRPNQLFSLSLSYPILNPAGKYAKEMVKTVKNELYTKHGLRTLDRKNTLYIATYEGDSFKRDMSYHQGITWPWLFGLYNDALVNIIKETKSVKMKKEMQDEYDDFIKNLKVTAKNMMYKEGCMLGISELYDSKPPYLPKGCFTQAWSVSEIFRILLGAK